MCQVTTTGKTWSYQEGGKHTNVLGLTVVKFAIKVVTKEQSSQINPLVNR